MRGSLPRFSFIPVLVAGLVGCTQFPDQVAPTRAAAVTVGATEMQMAVPSGMGALTVNVALGADDATRTVQAVGDTKPYFAEIDRIVFTVTLEQQKEPITATITKSQFLNNKAVLQINNLPVGKLTIHAVAQRADGSTVVEANGEGTVVPDQVIGIHLRCVPRPEDATGHVRIEMDCWTECGCATPKPSPTAFVPTPLKIVDFQSVGDPHEEGGNGVKFDNYRPGTFLALTTLTGDLVLEKTQDYVPGGTKWKGKTVNNAVAVKSDGDVFLYYVYGQRARLNGKAVSFQDGTPVSAPNGLRITKKGTDITLSTSAGDTITVRDKGFYLDVFGSVSGDRVVHEVKGALGTYNNGSAADAIRLRNGQVTTDMQAFLTDWLATPSEDLFPDDEPFVPAGYVYKDPAQAPAAAASPSPTPTPAPSTAPSAAPSAASNFTTPPFWAPPTRQ